MLITQKHRWFYKTFCDSLSRGERGEITGWPQPIEFWFLNLCLWLNVGFRGDGITIRSKTLVANKICKIPFSKLTRVMNILKKYS